jgi:hypothetical protein
MKSNLTKRVLLGICFALSLTLRAGAQTEATNTVVGKPACLPFIVYSDMESPSNHFTPSGWMGNTKSGKMNEGCQVRPHSGRTCIRCDYADNGEWLGVVWQDPPNDWGDVRGGWNLTGAKRLTFWARGDKGGEIVSFKFGVLGSDKRYCDSAMGGLEAVVLTRNWKQYSIDLANKDLSCIKTGFAWSLTGQGRPVVFYLDDIQFE